MRMRVATPDDFDTIWNLRVQLREWLASRGIEQWTPAWDDKARQGIADNIAAGITFMSEDDLASITLGGPDMDFWDPEWDGPLDNALYIYKFMVSREAAGIDLGGEILDWAAGYAAATYNRFLRLDIWRTNDKLATYYKSQGFYWVRTVELEHRASGMLFEKIV